MNGLPPHRIRITHPRTDAAHRPRFPSAPPDLDEHTALDAVSLSTLIRVQRRLAILVCALVAGALSGAAVLGVLSPYSTRLRWFGVPLPWLVLGLLIYPVLILLGVYAVRQAERNEKAFAELVRRR